MNENQPTNVQLETNKNGTVSFATDVIATIAGLAATEVEGVNSMYSTSSGLADIFSRRSSSNTKGLTRGVRVEMDADTLVITLSIIVDYGFPVPEIAKGIQENVKKAVETMSGLTVSAIHVHVQGVSFEREMKAAAEIEEQQRLLLQKQQEEDEKRDAEKTAEPAAEAQVKAQADEDDEFELVLEDVPEETEPAEAEPEQEENPDHTQE